MFFKVVKTWWDHCSSVKQLGSGWDAELLGVSSGSKLFAYVVTVAIGRMRVKHLQYTMCDCLFYQKRELLICLQYWSLLNWRNLRLRCGSVAVAVNWLFVFISLFFAMFKNVVHSLEPGETQSNSASHQAPNYVQRSSISQNTSKRCVAVAVRLRLFFNLLKTSTVHILRLFLSICFCSVLCV